MSSGTGEVIYIALQSWFASIAKPTDMVISASHSFNADKGFLRLQATPQKNSASGKSSGELGMNNTQYTIQGFIAGSYALQHSLLRSITNKPLFVIVPDTSDPTLFYQIGSEDIPAYIKPEFSTGTSKDGTKGYAIDASSSNSAFAIYEGTIAISPDEVSLLLALMIDDVDYLINELEETIDTE